jgi:predicted PurR-regulated permease PerM
MGSGSSTFGERIIHPETIWDRVVRWGVFCAALSAIVGVVVSAFVFLILPFRVVFAPIALALVVVYLLNPLVSMLERRGMRRGFAVAIIFLGFVGIVSGAMALLIPVITRQIGAFIDHLPGYVEDATSAINRFAARRHLNFRIHLTTEQIQSYVFKNKETIVGVLGGVRSFAASLIHVLITLVIGVILSVYILLDLPKIQKGIREMLPPGRRDEITGLAEKIGGALGGFFRGQLLVALFVGLASALGLTLVKVPFAAVVGLIAGVFNLVPLIGPFIGAIPAVILGLLSGHAIRALWGALVLLLVQQIDNHIISPNVMGRTVKLHPITVMLALLAAGSMFGIFGMLLVIPAIAAIKAVAQHLWSKRSVREALAEAMPGDVASAVAAAGLVATTVAEPGGDIDEGATEGRAPSKRRTSRGSRAGTKRKRSGSR